MVKNTYASQTSILFVVAFSLSASCLGAATSDSAKKPADAEVDCSKDTNFGAVDYCEELKGEKQRKIVDEEFKKKYQTHWNIPTKEAIHQLKPLVDRFIKIETRNINDSLQGGEPGILNSLQARWFAYVIRKMEDDPIEKVEVGNAKRDDKKLNDLFARYKKYDDWRAAEREWLKVRDQIIKIYTLRFQGKQPKQFLIDGASDRATRMRIEDFEEQMRK